MPFYNITFISDKSNVVGIKDGDTVVVLLEGNKQEILRLADVDCPESGQSFGKTQSSSPVFGKNIDFTKSIKIGMVIKLIIEISEKLYSKVNVIYIICYR